MDRGCRIRLVDNPRWEPIPCVAEPKNSNGLLSVGTLD